MPKILVLSGEELIKLLQKSGFEIVRRKGSHVSLQESNYKTVVPLHDELAIGTLMGILKQCGLDRAALLKLMRKKH